MTQKFRSQLQEANRIIQENVTEENVRTMNKESKFRELARSVSNGNLSTLILTKNYLNENFPEYNLYEAYIRRDPEQNSMLHNACLNQRLHIVRFLLQDMQNHPINSLNQFGLTPLQMMIMNVAINKKFSQELFDLLLANGADILVRDSQRRTILEFLQIFNEDFQGKEYIEFCFRKQRSKEAKKNFAFAWQYCTDEETLLFKLGSDEVKQILQFI